MICEQKGGGGGWGGGGWGGGGGGGGGGRLAYLRSRNIVPNRICYMHLEFRRQLSMPMSTRAGGNKVWLLSFAVTRPMKYPTELWPLVL